jgi:hypothetical protein
MKYRAKDYSRIAKNASQRGRVKGKAKVISCVGGVGGFTGGGFGGFNGTGFGGGVGNVVGPGRHFTCNPFIGPSLAQRLHGYAVASTLVVINLENASFQGRIISVDADAFEVTVTDPLTSVFTLGAIVTVNFNQVNAISAGNF